MIARLLARTALDIARDGGSRHSGATLALVWREAKVPHWTALAKKVGRRTPGPTTRRHVLQQLARMS